MLTAVFEQEIVLDIEVEVGHWKVSLHSPKPASSKTQERNATPPPEEEGEEGEEEEKEGKEAKPTPPPPPPAYRTQPPSPAIRSISYLPNPAPIPQSSSILQVPTPRQFTSQAPPAPLPLPQNLRFPPPVHRAPYPPSPRIASTQVPRLLPFPNQHQRSVSAPPAPDLSSYGYPSWMLEADDDGEEEDGGEQKDEGAKESALSAFQHWLSLFPEHSIPLPFRDMLVSG